MKPQLLTEQEGLKEVVVSVVKEELVRVEGLPFLQRIPGLPELERGRRLRLAVLGCDYIDLRLETKLLEVLPESESVTDLEDEDEDVPEAQAEVPAEEKAPETTAEKTAETTPAA